METNTKNFFETIMDSQKQFVDKMTQGTENISKTFTNNVNNDLFKKWYDNQMSFFYKNGNAEQAENHANNPMDFFTNIMKNPMTTGIPMFDNMNKMFQGMNNFSTGMNGMNGMFNGMNGFSNPFSGLNGSQDQVMGYYNNWMNMLTNSYNTMLANFNTNGTQKDAFSGIFNTAEMHMKMFEFWMPMLKSIQDKTFTAESFKTFFNAEKYKEMMDKMFQLNPEQFNQMKDLFLESIKSNMGKGKEAYEAMKTQMNALPKFGNENFNSALEQYNTFTTNLNETMSPFVKMMSPGKDKDQMLALSELANKMVAYQVRESQYRHMIYTTGLKAMETLAESVYAKMEKGEDFKDFTTFYNEYLTVNDTVYGELFASPEYSKFQSEFTEIVMMVRKGVESQMEKMLVNIPVITRTEMDELYKTIYDLKKMVRGLEKALDTANNVVVKEEKAPVAKTSKK